MAVEIALEIFWWKSPCFSTGYYFSLIVYVLTVLNFKLKRCCYRHTYLSLILYSIVSKGGTKTLLCLRIGSRSALYIGNVHCNEIRAGQGRTVCDVYSTAQVTIVAHFGHQGVIYIENGDPTDRESVRGRLHGAEKDPRGILRTARTMVSWKESLIRQVGLVWKVFIRKVSFKYSLGYFTCSIATLRIYIKV